MVQFEEKLNIVNCLLYFIINGYFGCDLITYIIKEGMLESANAKLQSDLQITYKYVDALIPGEWQIVDGQVT